MLSHEMNWMRPDGFASLKLFIKHRNKKCGLSKTSTRKKVCVLSYFKRTKIASFVCGDCEFQYKITVVAHLWPQRSKCSYYTRNWRSLDFNVEAILFLFCVETITRRIVILGFKMSVFSQIYIQLNALESALVTFSEYVELAEFPSRLR